MMLNMGQRFDARSEHVCEIIASQRVRVMMNRMQYFGYFYFITNI